MSAMYGHSTIDSAMVALIFQWDDLSRTFSVRIPVPLALHAIVGKHFVLYCFQIKNKFIRYFSCDDLLQNLKCDCTALPGSVSGTKLNIGVPTGESV